MKVTLPECRASECSVGIQFTGDYGGYYIKNFDAHMCARHAAGQLGIRSHPWMTLAPHGLLGWHVPGSCSLSAPRQLQVIWKPGGPSAPSPEACASASPASCPQQHPFASPALLDTSRTL